jgi:hypothetical protein
MKRWTPLALLGIVAALLLGFQLTGSSTEAGEDEVSSVVCYKARTEELAVKSNFSLLLSDQFAGEVKLFVLKVHNFCNGAEKGFTTDSTSETAGGAILWFEDGHTTCYVLQPRNNHPARGTEIEVSDQFGEHQLRLRYPHRVCTVAAKEGQKISLDGGVLTCYSVTHDEGQVPFFGKHEFDVHDVWFDEDHFVEIEAYHSVCVPALKSFPGTLSVSGNGQSVFDALNCYKLEDEPRSVDFLTIEDQFGDQDISVRRLELFCTLAHKIDDHR